jgi:hypothetical protein
MEHHHVKQNKDAGYTFKLQRELTSGFPQEKYTCRDKKTVKTLIHWGQRKLLLSEIEFLTQHAKKGDTIIYAGAAPGTHILILIQMFRKLRLHYVLVDPNNFDSKLKRKKETTILQEYFTDELATTLGKKHKNILFISDVRRADPYVMSPDDVEKLVWEDHIFQLKWHDILKPRYSMFKFRLPWDKKTVKYADGIVKFQIWATKSSSETRIIIKKKYKKKTWDCKKYENQLYFFNNRFRPSLFHPKKTWGISEKQMIEHGMDHCYDCCAELLVLSKYMKKYPNPKIKTLSKMVGFITKQLGSRHLSHGNITKKHISSKLIEVREYKLSKGKKVAVVR